jgi:response regulator NasT
MTMDPIRLVLVDDDTIIRLNLRELLHRQGYVVVGEAGDAESAVNLTRELRPDLVIMDVRIAGPTDGIAAAAAITAERTAPVLLLTGFNDPVLVERASAAGVGGYLLKPVKHDALRPAIEIAVGRFQATQALTAEADNLREQLETRKLVNRAKAILMRQYNLSEAEAFQRLQRVSMNSRKPLRAVAEAILLAQQVG